MPLTSLHDDSSQKYQNRVLRDVNQQDCSSGSWTTGVQSHLPQNHDQALSFPLGFISSGQVMSHGHNGVTVQHLGPMTHTSLTVRIRPEYTTPCGSSTKMTFPSQTHPSMTMAPPPIPPVPNKPFQPAVQVRQTAEPTKARSAASSMRAELGKTVQNQSPEPIPTAGAKRRLGMGRSTTGYANKKFKPPT